MTAQRCRSCGHAIRYAVRQFPFHCRCGSVARDAAEINNYDLPVVRVSPERDEAERKMAICRTNQCGMYDRDGDACRILTAKGKAGRISYLRIAPSTACVNVPPLF